MPVSKKAMIRHLCNAVLWDCVWNVYHEIPQKNSNTIPNLFTTIENIHQDAFINEWQTTMLKGPKRNMPLELMRHSSEFTIDLNRWQSVKDLSQYCYYQLVQGYWTKQSGVKAIPKYEKFFSDSFFQSSYRDVLCPTVMLANPDYFMHKGALTAAYARNLQKRIKDPDYQVLAQQSDMPTCLSGIAKFYDSKQSVLLNYAQGAPSASHDGNIPSSMPPNAENATAKDITEANRSGPIDVSYVCTPPTYPETFKLQTTSIPYRQPVTMIGSRYYQTSSKATNNKKAFFDNEAKAPKIKKPKLFFSTL